MIVSEGEYQRDNDRLILRNVLTIRLRFINIIAEIEVEFVSFIMILYFGVQSTNYHAVHIEISDKCLNASVDDWISCLVQ